MKRRAQSKDVNQINHQELSKKTAIHEAGHAAAIYLGNKQKQLPPVFFQIYIKELNNDFQATECLCKANDNCIAIVEGGRLIHTLPSSIEEATEDFSLAQKQAYQIAFEADIINILAGPLAEAKYVAFRDDELFNPHLINIDALRNYGGSSNIEAVNEYLECFIACDEQRRDKATELFLAAFSFVSNVNNWKAITGLANYLLDRPKNTISCEEVMAVVDRACMTRLDDAWPLGFKPKSWLQTEPFPL